MKRIGIISLFGDHNYGNKLQNYAVQHFFRDLGMDTVILRTPWLFREKITADRFLNPIRHIKICLTDAESCKTDNALLNQRMKRFRKFNETHLTITPKSMDRYDVYRKKPRCDYYVVGSDQVWNYKYGTVDALYFLRFAPPRKRLSIAASFGVDTIPQPYARKAGKYLQEMRLITVRENTGKRLVAELSGRRASLILDPTLLIPEECWYALERKPQCKIPERYIFTYFLGDVAPERKARVETFAMEQECEIVCMNDAEYPEYYELDPTEFLYMIHHAVFVVTDSFHGCAFSIIYRKNFWIMKRSGRENDMLDRLLTLLSIFELKDRLLGEQTLSDVPVDFSGTSNTLNKERQKAKDLFWDVFQEDNDR